MKKHISLIYTKAFSVGFALLFLLACKKDAAFAELNVASKLLADKIWYLDYAKITTAGSTANKNYIGQSTYSINFLNNYTTSDSDGLVGIYSVEKNNGQLQIHVQVKTNNGNNLEYIYNIESIGAKHLVLTSTNAQTFVKQYFSVH
jgi:hypothetical protein